MKRCSSLLSVALAALLLSACASRPPPAPEVERHPRSIAIIPVLDPKGDADGDGQNNAAEDFAGTNPLDATSLFRITSAARNATAHTTTITWSSVVGRKYEVDASGDLVSGTFTAVANGTVTATGATTSFTDTSTANPKFYRVRVLQ